MEYLIIPCVLVSIQQTVMNYRQREFTPFTLCEIVQSVMSICIILPLCEEAIFRSVLKNSFENYDMMINVCLFSAIHLVNYFVNYNLFQILIQLINTGILGYLCYNQQSFYMAYFIHSLYNMIIVLGSIIIHNITFVPKKVDHIFYVETKRVGPCRYARDDIAPSSITISISYNKMKPDMIHRIEQLKNRQNKCYRYKNCWDRTYWRPV